MQIEHILIKFKLSPLKLLNQIKPNLAGMVPRWVPFKIMSDNPTHHSKWLLLLKIDISSIVHIGFKHQRENKQNSDNTYVDFIFLLSQENVR